jgi:hypothetical protein
MDGRLFAIATRAIDSILAGQPNVIQSDNDDHRIFAQIISDEQKWATNA